jgi:hypothetical protein
MKSRIIIYFFALYNNPDPSILPRLYMLNREAVGPDKQWTYSSALSGFLHYREVVKNLANDMGIVLIDLDKEIPKTLHYFYDYVH